MARSKTHTYQVREGFHTPLIRSPTLQESLNLTENLDTTVTEVGGAVPDTLFESSWAYTTGRSVDAVLDGTGGGRKWNEVVCVSDLLEVHADGGDFGDTPQGLNCLGVDNTTGGACRMINTINQWEAARGVGVQAQDFALRYWFRYNYGPGGDAHEIEQHGNSYQGAWAWTVTGSAGSTGSILSVLLETYGEYNVGHADGAGYERSGWTVDSGLDTGTWYRFEMLVKFLSLSTYRLFPRIYSVTNLGTGAGSLIQDWDTVPSWGRGDGSYTLGGWYDLGSANENLHYDEDYDSGGDGYHTQFNDFVIGNNGGTGRGTNTDCYAFCGLKFVDGESMDQDDDPWVGP